MSVITVIGAGANGFCHADIETTGNIYTHIHKQRKESLSKDLEGTLKIAL